MTVEITTERLILRPMAMGDANFILSIVNTEGWLNFIGDRKIKTLEHASIYINSILENPDYHYNIIELKVTKQALGIVSFLKRETYEHSDLGFALLPVAEGKGIAFESCNAYLNHLKYHIPNTIVIAIVRENNIRSKKLIEKLGFKESHSIIEFGIKQVIYEIKI